MDDFFALFSEVVGEHGGLGVFTRSVLALDNDIHGDSIAWGTTLKARVVPRTGCDGGGGVWYCFYACGCSKIVIISGGWGLYDCAEEEVDLA